MKRNPYFVIVPAVVALVAGPPIAMHYHYADALAHGSTISVPSEEVLRSYEEARAAGNVGFEWKHGDKSSFLENGVLTASWSGEVVNRDVPGKLILTLDGFDEANFTADELDDTEVRIRFAFTDGDTHVWRGSLRDFAMDGGLINEMGKDSRTIVQAGEAVTFDLRVTSAPTAQPYTPMTELPELSVVAHHVY